ncbi:MAG: transglycosylase domain-containing protein [Bdellovibrionaceae bacterium]|jgi:monofunctional biosynthetic peptidoglycan transglycosylase|nr:transglycosylase domain-containing protein [Pseudobdellovibrionaceae bacterium]
MKLLKIFGIITISVLTATAIAAGLIFLKLPTENEIRGCVTTTMYQVHLCPGSSDYVLLKSISPYLQKAIVLTEDSGFWDHDGFDWKSIEENAKKNLESKTYSKGGSTISQQLAKNMFLYKDKTLIRKGLEALITQKIEKTLTKKEILERYLNVVEFGKNIYGVKQASSFYFRKSPAQLDLVESAFLAMVLPNPQKYSQSYFRKELTPFAHKRLKKIVGDLFKYSRINEDEYNVAINRVDAFFSPSPDSDPAMDGVIEDIESSLSKGAPATLDELEDLDSEESTDF